MMAHNLHVSSMFVIIVMNESKIKSLKILMSVSVLVIRAAKLIALCPYSLSLN